MVICKVHVVMHHEKRKVRWWKTMMRLAVYSHARDVHQSLSPTAAHSELGGLTFQRRGRKLQPRSRRARAWQLPAFPRGELFFFALVFFFHGTHREIRKADIHLTRRNPVNLSVSWQGNAVPQFPRDEMFANRNRDVHDKIGNIPTTSVNVKR